MKKIFGICLLLAGLFLIGMGIIALTDFYSRSNTIENQLGDFFSENHRSRNTEQQVFGFLFLIGGTISFVSGIAMVSTKSRSQLNKETELELLKQHYSKGEKSNKFTGNETSNVNQLELLIKYRQQGYITEEEFQEQKRKLFSNT